VGGRKNKKRRQGRTRHKVSAKKVREEIYSSKSRVPNKTHKVHVTYEQKVRLENQTLEVSSKQLKRGNRHQKFQRTLPETSWVNEGKRLYKTETDRDVVTSGTMRRKPRKSYEDHSESVTMNRHLGPKRF
jgi:hypothetical protein